MRKTLRYITVLSLTFLIFTTHPSAFTIKNAIEQMTEEMPYTFIDTELNESEIMYLQQLSIEKHKTRYSVIEPDKMHTITYNFLLNIGNNKATSKRASDIILKQLNEFLKVYNPTKVLFVLKSYTPIERFKEPNWHIDLYQNMPIDFNPAIKLVWTIKGQPTLFCSIEDNDVKEKAFLYYVTLQQKDALIKTLENQLVTQPQTGKQIALFNINSAFHSEPNIIEPRIFIGLVPVS